MVAILEILGVVFMVTVGAALPVLVTIISVRTFREQLRAADPAARRRMRNGGLFSTLALAAIVAAMFIGLEAVLILGVVCLIGFLAMLPFIARADMRSRRTKPTDSVVTRRRTPGTSTFAKTIADGRHRPRRGYAFAA